ncbi:MAG TPA: MBL fold metallo-hydrolase [Thermoanaerobaculia bacterium]|nr:MBL fold metallo-hydrolase [Thermoanaerobaculia bacterium]
MRRAIVGLLAVMAAPVLAQPDFSKVEVKATKVAGTVYMLQGQGGNIGVSVGEDGIVIVDDQFAPLAPKIRAALKGITDKPIKFILNTHFHGDHTGGNIEFSKDGPIIAHENVRKRLQSGSTAAGRSTPPAPKDALPVITFNDRATVHINGEDIRAIHMPHGHTDGDAVIWFTQSNVVHMGDDFFNGTFPFVDIDNGGSVRGLSMNLEAIIAQIRDDTKVIPGHGPLGDKATLRTFAEMIRTSSAAVDAAMRSGKTLDQIKQQKVLDPWSKWASSFITVDRWADTLYRDLGGTLPPAPATSTQHH